MKDGLWRRNEEEDVVYTPCSQLMYVRVSSLGFTTGLCKMPIHSYQKRDTLTSFARERERERERSTLVCYQQEEY